MSTSVRKRSAGKNNLLKTAAIYLAAAAISIIINRVYAIFGHGVSSAAMSLMFLYPLIGGAAVFFGLWALYPKACKTPKYRLHYNLYNSGIATLTIGSMLKGVFEIAGTASAYTAVYYVLGFGFLLAALTGFIISLDRAKYADDIFG